MSNKYQLSPTGSRPPSSGHVTWAASGVCIKIMGSWGGWCLDVGKSAYGVSL